MVASTIESGAPGLVLLGPDRDWAYSRRDAERRIGDLIPNETPHLRRLFHFPRTKRERVLGFAVNEGNESQGPIPASDNDGGSTHVEPPAVARPLRISGVYGKDRPPMPVETVAADTYI